MVQNKSSKGIDSPLSASGGNYTQRRLTEAMECTPVGLEHPEGCPPAEIDYNAACA
jgi:hypothetical protein